MTMIKKEMIDLDQQMLDGELTNIKAIPGERWFPLETTIEQDFKEYWGGDWGCSSEYTKLRAVLLHRPGAEIDNFDYNEVRFRAPVDPELFRAQHDTLADYYRSHGVKVYYTPGVRPDRPNAVFCRDKLFMTPEGAIITRLAMEQRRGEERYVAQACADIGVPIVKTIAGDGIFEGANATWVDRHCCILSLSVRANRSGYDQMVAELTRQGVTDIITMQIPYGHAHIDGNLNMASHDIAMINAPQVPYDVCDALMKKGIKLLECPSRNEAKETFAINFVAIEPGLIVMPAGNPRSQELLEKNGIKVIAVEIGELEKGYGAMHCCTAFLKRG